MKLTIKNKLLLIGIAFIIFLAEAEIDIVVPSFPGLMNYYGASVFQTELTLTLNLIAHSLAGLWIGSLVDIHGKKKILLFGVLAFVAGSALTVVANNIYILLLGRALQGAGVAAPMVIGYLIAIDGISKSLQESRISVLNGIANTSLAFTPALGSIVAVNLGWQANLQLLFILGIVALAIVIFVVPKDRTQPQEAMTSPNKIGYFNLLKSKNVGFLIISTLFLPAGWFTFVGLASIIYVENFGATLSQYGWYQGFIALIYGIVSFLSYKLTRFFGIRTSVIASFTALILAILGLVFGFVFNLYAPAYVTAMMLLGSIGSVLLVNKTHLFAVTVQPEYSGKINALITFGRWVLAAIAIQLSGLLFTLSPNAAFLVISVLWASGLLYLWLLMKKNHTLKNFLFSL